MGNFKMRKSVEPVKEKGYTPPKGYTPAPIAELQPGANAFFHYLSGGDPVPLIVTALEIRKAKVKKGKKRLASITYVHPGFHDIVSQSKNYIRLDGKTEDWGPRFLFKS